MEKCRRGAWVGGFLNASVPFVSHSGRVPMVELEQGLRRKGDNERLYAPQIRATTTNEAIIRMFAHAVMPRQTLVHQITCIPIACVTQALVLL